MTIFSFRKSLEAFGPSRAKPAEEVDSSPSTREVSPQVAAAGEALSRAIGTAAQNAVEVQTSEYLQLRTSLEKLVEMSRVACREEEIEMMQASFRGELRAYRDKAQASFQKLREELASASETIRSFSAQVLSTNQDHEKAVHNELKHLESAAEEEDLEKIRSAVSHTVQTIDKQCRQLKLENQLIIAQLQDEIRVLHREAEKERRAMETDMETGAWTRQKTDGRITDLILVNQPFTLFMIGVTNYHSLFEEFTADLVYGALRALVERARNIAGEDAMVSRWTKDIFTVIVDLSPESVTVTAEALLEHLSGAYSVQSNGITHTVPLELQLITVGRKKDMPEGEFYPNVGQAAFDAVRAVSTR